MPKNLHGSIVNLVVLILGIILFISARTIEVGAMLGAGSELVPQLVTTLWVMLAIPILIMGLRKEEVFGKKVNIKPFLITLALLLGYALLLRPIGFVLTSMIYCFLQTLVYSPEDKRTKKDYIIFGVISIAVPIIINFVFANFFLLFLPQGDVIRIPFLF